MKIDNYSLDSSQVFFNQVKTSLIDPLAINLSNHVEWWEIDNKKFSQPYKYPVAVIGEGSPLLLLHGFDSCFLEFRRLVPELSLNHKILIPDMFGFGFCPRPPNANYGKDAILLHLSNILDLIQGSQPIGVIGASMGGAIAMEVARMHPDRIDKLMLLSPAGLTGKQQKVPPLIDQMGVWFLSRPFVRRGLCKQAFANPKDDVGEKEEQIASIHLGVPGWKESLASFAREGGLSNCGLPIPPQLFKVIWGSKDRILKGKVKEETYQLLGSYIEEIEECGHLPHIDKPKIVAEKWLAEK